MKITNKYKRWALLWVQGTSAMGDETCSLIGWPDTGMTRFYRTRREAREMREERYGYIRERPDLRAAPHHWRMPRVVKCTITIEADT